MGSTPQGTQTRERPIRHQSAPAAGRANRAALGLQALGALGPIGLGTQISAVVAISIGTTARAVFAWIGAGTIIWSIIAAVAAVSGLSLAGIGT